MSGGWCWNQRHTPDGSHGCRPGWLDCRDYWAPPTCATSPATLGCLQFETRRAHCNAYPYQNQGYTTTFQHGCNRYQLGDTWASSWSECVSNLTNYCNTRTESNSMIHACCWGAVFQHCGTSDSGYARARGCDLPAPSWDEQDSVWSAPLATNAGTGDGVIFDCFNDYDVIAGVDTAHPAIPGLQLPWEDFQSCAAEQQQCEDHPTTLMAHCRSTCGTCGDGDRVGGDGAVGHCPLGYVATSGRPRGPLLFTGQVSIAACAAECGADAACAGFVHDGITCGVLTGGTDRVSSGAGTLSCTAVALRDVGNCEVPGTSAITSAAACSAAAAALVLPDVEAEEMDPAGCVEYDTIEERAACLARPHGCYLKLSNFGGEYVLDGQLIPTTSRMLWFNPAGSTASADVDRVSLCRG